jgi:hypothetical protein
VGYEVAPDKPRSGSKGLAGKGKVGQHGKDSKVGQQGKDSKVGKVRKKGGKAPATGGAGPPPEPEPDEARQLTEAVLDAAVHPSQAAIRVSAA